MENLKEYWRNPKLALKELNLDNIYDHKLYDLIVDSRRQSALLRSSIRSTNDSSEDENFSVFGINRAFPDIQTVIDKWVKEVEVESRQENWLI